MLRRGHCTFALWRSSQGVHRVPFIDVARGQTAHFHTIGVYETFSGPNSILHRPSTWRCIEMNGTAQSVIVPLSEKVS